MMALRRTSFVIHPQAGSKVRASPREQRLDGAVGDTERGGHLRHRLVEHVVHHGHLALAFGQYPQCVVQCLVGLRQWCLVARGPLSSGPGTVAALLAVPKLSPASPDSAR